MQAMMMPSGSTFTTTARLMGTFDTMQSISLQAAQEGMPGISVALAAIRTLSITPYAARINTNAQTACSPSSAYEHPKCPRTIAEHTGKQALSLVASCSALQATLDTSPRPVKHSKADKTVCLLYAVRSYRRQSDGRNKNT